MKSKAKSKQRSQPDLMEALLERRPELQATFVDACKSDIEGDSEPLLNFLTEATMFEPRLISYARVLQTERTVAVGRRKLLAVSERLFANEKVPLRELCEAYDAGVLGVQECHEERAKVPPLRKTLMLGVWGMTCGRIGRELAIECERRGMDSTPLHAAGIDPSLSRAVDANALVGRLTSQPEEPPKHPAAAANEYRSPAWIRSATANGLTADSLDKQARRGKLKQRRKSGGQWEYHVPEVAEANSIYSEKLLDALKEVFDFRKPRKSEGAKGTKPDKGGQGRTKADI